MELHWDSWMGACHGYLPWQAQVQVTLGSPWNCIGAPGWVDAMDIFHGKLMWRSPWASHGIALGLLDGWMPWISSMASSCGDHHGHPMEWHLGLLDGWMSWIPSMASSCGDHHGHPMEWHWDSWMGGCHGYLPWQAHVEITMGIPWNGIGTPGWVDAMDIFHGKLMWRSPWASHGIALGLLDGWMPWISSMA